MYRTIDTKFWTDPKIRKLDPNGKLMALYLVTNPHAHLGGIYYLSGGVISSETGLSRRTVDTLWDTLSSAGFCRRDTDLEIVWVVKMFRYQNSGMKTLISTSNHLKTLHNSHLCKEFTDAYPAILGVKNGFNPDRVSRGYPAQGAQEQEQEQEQESPLTPRGGNRKPKRNREYKTAAELQAEDEARQAAKSEE